MALDNNPIDFARGSREKCETETAKHKEDILFATDSRTIWTGGVEYGSYTTALGDDTNCTNVGDIDTSMTAGDLKNKPINEILDMILFKSDPAVAGSVTFPGITIDTKSVVEVGTSVTASVSKLNKTAYKYIKSGNSYKSGNYQIYRKGIKGNESYNLYIASLNSESGLYVATPQASDSEGFNDTPIILDIDTVSQSQLQNLASTNGGKFRCISNTANHSVTTATPFTANTPTATVSGVPTSKAVFGTNKFTSTVPSALASGYIVVGPNTSSLYNSTYLYNSKGVNSTTTSPTYIGEVSASKPNDAEKNITGVYQIGFNGEKGNTKTANVTELKEKNTTATDTSIYMGSTGDFYKKSSDGTITSAGKSINIVQVWASGVNDDSWGEGDYTFKSIILPTRAISNKNVTFAFHTYLWDTGASKFSTNAEDFNNSLTSEVTYTTEDITLKDASGAPYNCTKFTFTAGRKYSAFCSTFRSYVTITITDKPNS